MKNYIFSGIFATEMNNFVLLRKSQGLRDYSKLYILEALDNFLIELDITDKLLTSSIVDDWLARYQIKCHVNTINNFINYYSPFARYLNSLGIIAFIPEHPIYQHSYTPYIFSESEVFKIIMVADEMDGSTNGRLSRVQFPMLLRILYGCGLRLGEALSLHLADFDYANGILKVWKGKGNMDRIVPTDESLTVMLRKYCNTIFRDRTDNPYLFKQASGNHRTAGWAQWYFNKVLIQSGIDKPKLPPHSRNICMHCLRHTFAVNALRKNVAESIDNYDSTPLLSVYMGHKHLTGTQIYLHMTSENSKDILDITNTFSNEIFPEVPKL